jgi:FkbM family methyltransferase
MVALARILSWMPFRVNVFGRKRDAIVAVSEIFYGSNKLKRVKFRGHVLDFTGSDHFKIFAFAPVNLLRDFEQSDLGRWMTANLKAEDRFVDIGANLGGYSFMAKSLGAEVDLFEPVPDLARVLKKNERAFGRCHTIALSDETGTVTFNISDSNVGGSSIEASTQGWEKSGYARQVEVDRVSFDEVFSAEIRRGEKFKLIKIDVEGHETSVVRGMEGALSGGLIEHLWCEVRGDDSDRNPGTFREVCAILAKYNFEAFVCENGVKRPFDPEKSNAPQFFDLLFESS